MPCDTDVASHDKLKRTLERAVNDPARWPEFYRTLMKAEIFVIGHSDAIGHSFPQEKKLISSIGGKDGTTGVPFFTSLKALRRSLK